MKKLFYLFLITLVSLSGFNSCSSEIDSNDMKNSVSIISSPVVNRKSSEKKEKKVYQYYIDFLKGSEDVNDISIHTKDHYYLIRLSGANNHYVIDLNEKISDWDWIRVNDSKLDKLSNLDSSSTSVNLIDPKKYNITIELNK